MKQFNIKHIVITGVGRSGTTILGKIIHSFEGVEYVYEPYTIQALLPLLTTIEKDHWKNLYHSYLYEDIFMGAVAGRNVNLNEMDDSCIIKAKD